MLEYYNGYEEMIKY